MLVILWSPGCSFAFMVDLRYGWWCPSLWSGPESTLDAFLFCWKREMSQTVPVNPHISVEFLLLFQVVIFHLRCNQCPGLCPKSGWWDWWIPLPTAAWGNVLNLTLIFAFISLFCGEIWWRPCVGQCNQHGLSAILYCCLSTYSFQEQQRPFCHLHQGSCT